MGQNGSKQQKTGKRDIRVKNPKQRVDQETITLLRNEYDRIQEAGTISISKFKSEVLGMHVPDIFGNQLYKMFASPIVKPQSEGDEPGQSFIDKMTPNSRQQQSSKMGSKNESQQQQQSQLDNLLVSHVMTFDDLIVLFTVFKDKRDEEIMQVIFELLKLSPDHFSNKTQEEQAQNWPIQAQGGKPNDYNPDKSGGVNTQFFMRQDLIWLCKIIQQPDRIAREYYQATQYSPNFPVTFDDWKLSYNQIKESPMFTWVPSVVDGLKEDNMNLDPLTADIDNKKTVSLNSTDRTKLVVEEVSDNEDNNIEKRNDCLTTLEIENIRTFWTNEIKNRPAQDVNLIFKRMFKDMKSSKLKKYIFESVSQVVGQTFAFMNELVLNICKDTNSQKRLTFLYNIFAKQQKQIRGKSIKDFIEIFRLPIQVFRLATFLTLEQYLIELDGIEVDYSALLAAKPMITAMTAITPETDEDEREAILSAMNGNKNLESLIYETLPDEQEYFVVENNFWEEWCTALAITNEGKYSIKKEHKDNIDNKSLMEDNHQFRMKDLTYKQDFVLLPKYVYYPLSIWYQCNKEITRTVIQFRRIRGAGMNDSIQSAMMSSQHSRRFLLSSQKFYNPKEGHFEEELVHKKGEFVYELEIYPCILYLALVTDKGDKPHIKAVINGKVDFNYLKKVVKSEGLPFEELQVSRKTSLQEVLQIAANTFDQNIKKGRLLIEDQAISGTILYQTLEEYGLRQGQLVYAEFSNNSNEFPTQILKEKLAAKQTKKQQQLPKTTLLDSQGNVVTMGTTVGLQNLGNTCYMNSALQVIANLKIVHEYFILQKLQQKQTNVRNPMGFKGSLVHAFSMLLQRMWQSQSPVVPRNFKFVIAKCSEQFVGFEQQDAQEYISFLIDGLHEELNIRMKKPYIKNPESKNRDLNELGVEQWSNSLLRNWSIIYFLFYGQMRSQITCRTCKTESTTFDIFSNVALSLPEPKQKTISIIVYRVPSRIKDILQNKTVKDDQGRITLQGFARADSDQQSDGTSVGGGITPLFNSNAGALQRMATNQSNRDRQHVVQFQESYNYMNNDQPMRIVIKVDNDIKITDLIRKISQIRELNIETPLVKTEIVVFQMTGSNNLKNLMNPEMKLSQFQNSMQPGQDLYAAEILTRTGREAIKKFYLDNKSFLQNHPGTVLRCLTYASEKGDPIEGVQGYPKPTNINTPAQKGMFNSQAQMSYGQNTQQMQRPLTGESESEYEDSYYSSNMSNVRGIRPPARKLDKYLVLSQVMQKAFNFASIESRVELPKDIFVVAYNRRFVKRTEYLFSQYVPQLIANPLMFTLPTVPSGRRIYEEVWASAHILLRHTSRFHRVNSRWWERRNWREILKKAKGKGIFSPFVLKAVDRTGYVCSLCHWMKKCSGCIILPTDAPIFEEDFIRKCFIAIEWHSKILDEGYNAMANEVVEHASTKKKALNEVIDQSNYTTLEDCLTKFHKTEQLENEVKCDRCRSRQVHQKRMEIFIPPPVLIIQLKRFRLFGQQWRKLTNLVDFPIRNLDLSAFTSDQRYIRDQLKIEPSYNLHGLVNHYGTLGFGHYVSFTKNPFDQKWYRYDDLNREEVTEDQLHKESAYLLFYVRKDLETKDLNQVMPNIEREFFTGKPVKMNNLDGFVTVGSSATPGGNSGNNQVTIKLKSQPMSSMVSINSLSPEEDKNEIQYTLAEQKLMLKFGPTSDKTNGTTENIKDKATKQRAGSTKCCSKMLKPQDQKRRPNSINLKLIKQSNGTPIVGSKKSQQQQQQTAQQKLMTATASTVANHASTVAQLKILNRGTLNKHESDLSLQSSFNQPLIKGQGIIKLQDSPDPTIILRNKGRKVELANGGTNLIQSEENPFTALPNSRRRFKMDDGKADRVGSVLSHNFSQSEINREETESSHDPLGGTIGPLINPGNKLISKHTALE